MTTAQQFDAYDDEIEIALRALSGSGRRLARRRLALARADHARTGDPAAVEHVVASLLLTAGLERTPGYAQTPSDPSPSGEAMDVADVVARLEAHDRDRAT